MLRATRHLLRLRGIARTLAREDALFFADQVTGVPAPVKLWLRLSRRAAPGRAGERLARALLGLGPSFIKLGQALATRSDLIGEAIADDLASLQDRMPPFPAAMARAIVAEELGRPLDQVFASFGDRPVAAASIAQVHFAVTTDGREVAVKILRPGIESAFAKDLDLLHWIAEWVETVAPSLRRLKPIKVVDTFADTVRMEMDLRLEGAAAAELRENFEDDPDFRVPSVDWERTARRVLTVERVNGIRIDDVQALVAAGHDPDAILAKSAQAFFRQVFRDGFFHADMHPGNMFVTSDGALAPVDFGIMGRIDRPTRIFLAEMLRGFLTGDYREVAMVHFRAGYVPRHKSLDAFAQACRSIGEPLMGKPLNEISVGRLLAQLFRVTETFEMEVQPQLLLLQKTMVVAEGVGRRLNPSVNMWQLAEPLIAGWMRENRGPEARIGEAASDLVRAVERLPRLLADAESAAAALGEGVRLHPETVKQLNATRPTGAHRALWAAIVVLGAAVAALALMR
ncbi:MAG: 2-polyprenylphenol 6-hydroxylase [Alphaproteobacteria bacterium]|nr:2-polyprenylphenol 6-hydroxylase [Alphaproteobacteria bacterium]